MSHAAPFLAHHGGHGDGRDAGDEVNLDHSAVDNDKDADGQRPHGEAHHEGLQPQPQKRPHVHLQQPRLKVRDMVGKVDGGVAYDKAGGAVDHALRRLEYAHDDVPSVRHDEHGSRRLEYPLKEYPCVDVVEVIAVRDKLYQLQCHDEGEDHAGDGQYHVVREGADHAVNIGVPRLRGAADVSRRLRDLGVDVIKEAGEVVHDAPDQQLLEPFGEFFPYQIQWVSPPFPPLPVSGGQGRRVLHCGMDGINRTVL